MVLRQNRPCCCEPLPSEGFSVLRTGHRRDDHLLAEHGVRSARHHEGRFDERFEGALNGVRVDLDATGIDDVVGAAEGEEGLV
jgi:hypothetical protein